MHIQIPSIILTIVSCLFINTLYAKNPCHNDHACFKVDGARFENPYHFVFVGVQPGDELSMAPFLKDHCSEENNYCAMIIATHGKSGCEFSSGNDCSNTRKSELKASAKYLNADLWHYNLPDDSEISPNTSEHIKTTYNKIAQASGFEDVSAYFRIIFQTLQLSDEKPLIVITLRPHHNLTSHPKHKTINVIDEFVTNAVGNLQREGMPISHYHADSQLRIDPHLKNKRPFVGKQDNSFVECRKGDAQLLATHTNLTNFEVFKHSYYNIYPSQTYQTGEISNDSNTYEFCFDKTITFFNTMRSEKLLGTLITTPNQLSEVVDFSNTFAFAPSQINEITDFLNTNSNKLLPTIEIGQFFFDKTLRVYNTTNVSPIIQAIQASSHNGPILFLIDEPLWHIRFACLKGSRLACEEINSNYSKTLALFRKIGQDLRRALPGSGIIHIESFAELLYQKVDHPSANIIMLDEAEYLGFDCYGPFDNCGIIDFTNIIPNVVLDSDTSTQSNTASLFQFTGNISPDSENTSTASDSQKATFICNGGLNDCVTVSFSSSVLTKKPQQTYIDWITHSLRALEIQNPIHRKMFLVPGAFQDFNFFPSEQKSIDQFNKFLQKLDSSDIFGGLGSFIWGNLQEASFPYIGTRSLANTRTVVTHALYTRTLKNTSYSLPPAMSLIGAVGKTGSFDKIKITNTVNGDIYFQSAGMDTCSINIGNKPSQTMNMDQLNSISIPNLTAPLRIEAQCIKGKQEFIKTINFTN